MLNKNNGRLSVIVVGCTPLARKVVELVEKMSMLVGVVNLRPDTGLLKSNYDPMVDYSRAHPEDIHLTNDINVSETYRWIVDRKPDVIIQCGWSQIFQKHILNVPRLFCIGIHPSPLPIGRGAAIINWKIIEGGGAWGNSLFVMEEDIDTGDILDFEPFDIEPRDDVRTAYLKVDRTAILMLTRTLPKIESNVFTRKAQEEIKATCYFKRTPADGRLDIRWDAEKISKYVRALTHPYPGAFFETILGPLIVWQGFVEKKRNLGQLGTIATIDRGRGICINVGSGGSFLLTLVTPPDGYECWSDEWTREQGLTVGQMLIKS